MKQKLKCYGRKKNISLKRTWHVRFSPSGGTWGISPTGFVIFMQFLVIFPKLCLLQFDPIWETLHVMGYRPPKQNKTPLKRRRILQVIKWNKNWSVMVERKLCPWEEHGISGLPLLGGLGVFHHYPNNWLAPKMLW